MTKTETKILCDDCGREIKTEFDLKYKVRYCIWDSKTCEFDICPTCINKRIKLSLKTWKIGDIKCKKCAGKGTVEAWTGVGHDYNTEKCPNCDGKGTLAND